MNIAYPLTDAKLLIASASRKTEAFRGDAVQPDDKNSFAKDSYRNSKSLESFLPPLAKRVKDPTWGDICRRPVEQLFDVWEQEREEMIKSGKIIPYGNRTTKIDLSTERPGLERATRFARSVISGEGGLDAMTDVFDRFRYA